MSCSAKAHTPTRSGSRDRFKKTLGLISQRHMNLTAIEVKAFVPALDLQVSKQFYLALGFEVPWESDDLAYVRHGECSFLLQAFDDAVFVQNYQMHLLVEAVDDWHAHVLACRVRERFGVRIGEPQNQSWAMRDFTLFDPSGVVWRVAQNIPRLVRA
ncbi:MAG: VOC family protein [Burkholderiaceae bacterium]